MSGDKGAEDEWANGTYMAVEGCDPQRLTAVNPDEWAQATWPLGAHPADAPPLTAREVLEAADSDPATATSPPHEGTEPHEVTFAVHAPRATRVLLEFYPAAIGADAVAEFDCARGDDGAWRARIGGVAPGAMYAFRVWGPNWDVDGEWTRGDSGAGFVCDVDADGDRFNPNKVLFDPYAREVSHNLASPQIVEHGGEPGVFVTGAEQVRDRPRRELDSGRWAPKGVHVVDSSHTGERPRLAREDAFIYEAHVRGLTAHPSSVKLAELLGTVPGFEEITAVPEELRGTYAGAAWMAPYLTALGMSTIEFLPVHQSTSSGRPQGPHDDPENYWGYESLAYFAPNREYAHDRSPGGPTREFKAMIAAFHAAGLEVFLDVVYNHSGEGGHWDGDVDSTAFTSLGGFAAQDYYVLTSDNELVDGATGVSNQMNFGNEITCRLTLDSLCYWTHDMGIDGFRFDLAPVLGRKPDPDDRDDWARQREFFEQHPLLVQIVELADRSRVEVVAEAWDLWGYEVGNFPAGWAEWNDRYRDALRLFAKGAGNTQAFIEQVDGDHAHFHDQGGPVKSIDFVSAHDGFTLMDLVSYEAPTNASLTWPFGPSDGGMADNKAWDSDGDQALRRTRVRNFLTLLVFSRGIPMIVSGDEYGRGQNGNNNPWALNTIGIWNNWAQAATNVPMRIPVDPANPESSGMYYDVFGEADTPEDLNPLVVLTRALAQLRHVSPALRQRSWGEVRIGGPDVSYHYLDAAANRWSTEGDRALQVLIDVGEVDSGDFLLLVNMEAHETVFALRGPHENRHWERIVDTAPYAEHCCNVFSSLADIAGLDESDEVDVISADTYAVHPWSVVVLREVPD